MRPFTPTNSLPRKFFIFLGMTSSLAMLLLGIAKFLDIPAFAQSLKSWSLIPTFLRSTIAFAIPSLEFALGFSFFLFPSLRGQTLRASCLLMLCFTAVIGAHLLFAEPPTCNCMGILAKYVQDKQTWPWLVGKSLGMALCFAFAWRFSTEPERDQSPAPGTGAPRARRFAADPARAFTLLETLIVITMIALLIGLLAPSLSGTRLHARLIKSTAQLREHATVFTGYCNDNRDTYPCPLDPRADLWINRRPDESFRMHYFEFSNYWPDFLGPSLYNAAGSHEMFFPAELREWTPRGGPFQYPCVFLARPEFWNLSTRTDRSQWGGVRASDVTHPSRKTLLMSQAWLYALKPGEFIDTIWARAKPIPTGFTDGHAALIPGDKLLKGVPTAENIFDPAPFPLAHSNDFWHGLHTTDGIRGIDF